MLCRPRAREMIQAAAAGGHIPALFVVGFNCYFAGAGFSRNRPYARRCFLSVLKIAQDLQ